MTTLEDLMELDTLNECTYECTRQSRWKGVTQRYISNMLVKNLELQEEVLGFRYKVSPTTNFKLNERGHIRNIEAPSIRDRIVQKTLVKNILMPSLRPYVIYDNYASLKNRGTQFARKRLERMLRNYVFHNGTDGYILLIDIKGYFENIDHEVLKSLIAPRISKEDPDIIKLIHYIIDTSSKSNKGLNLGSEAPQILAIYYLHPLDEYMKVVKSIKYYGRYMDDIFIISKSKDELKLLLDDVETITGLLHLQVNKKKTHIVKLTHGFTFLQIKYNILSSGKILKRISHNKIVRERRRLKAFKRMLDCGKMTELDVLNCYKSWRGSVLVDHNAYYNTIRSMDNLYSSLFPNKVQDQRKSRNKLCADIYIDANKNDFKTILS